jgi:hypothetical protein
VLRHRQRPDGLGDCRARAPRCDNRSLGGGKAPSALACDDDADPCKY